MLATALCVLPMRFRDLDVRLPLPMNDGAFDLMEHEDSIPGTQLAYVNFKSGNFLLASCVFSVVSADMGSLGTQNI